MMVDSVERDTGERPNHGEKWFPKLMAVCAMSWPNARIGEYEQSLSGQVCRLMTHL
jgi:hypothetical protein